MSILSWLGELGLLTEVLLPPEVEGLLTGLTLDPPDAPATADGIRAGSAKVGGAVRPLCFDFSLDPLGPPLPFRLTPDAGGFVLAFDLSGIPPATRLAPLAANAANQALLAASHQGAVGGEEWLTETGGPVRVTGASLALIVEGRRGAVATMRLAPSLDQPAGVVHLRLEPPTVLLGSTGFGLELPEGFCIDMSREAAPPPATAEGRPFPLPGDAPEWRGLSIRQARFYLPASVPLFGRTAVEARVEIGLDPAGLAVSLETHAPARDNWPAMTVRIECLDPGATGIASFLPTLVEAAAELPVNGHAEEVNGMPLRFLSSRPLVFRARFSRETADPATPARLSIGVESQDENGILAVRAEDGAAAKGVIAAAAFATALVAEHDLDGAPRALIGAGIALGALLNDQGRLVVHAVELATGGGQQGLGLAEKQTFTVDYSVEVAIKPLVLGVLSVSLDPKQPLRIRMRNVVLSLDHARRGLDMVGLDFEHATMEIEDPGLWLVDGPGSLFDVLGSRSGRGSIWLEVDLQFKLNLGPVQVSGATIRATMDPRTGKFSASIRGLDARLDLPGVVSGEGKVEVTKSGFSALLAVRIVPVGLAAEAFVRVQGKMVLLALAVDLPGPIPLFNSGLGLYGVGGAFGVAARIGTPAAGQDPVEYALAWHVTQDGAFVESPGNFSFGLEAVVGTLPDLGFAFSAKAGLFLTVPDLIVRGALDATILSSPVKVTDRPDPGEKFLTLRGALVIDPQDAVTFGLFGRMQVPVLLDAKIPGGGRFPCGKQTDPSDWYFYLGADGYKDEGRAMGPATITVLPNILKLRADGYLMLRGRNITRFPRGEASAQSYQGFILAFGFGVELSFGPRPIVWAEVNAKVDILLATSPLVLAGLGHVDGSVHLGPASVGVSADLQICVSEGRTSVYARVCGHVNLLLTTIRKCVKLKFGSEPPLTVPWPDVLPLDRVEGGEVVGQCAVLIDDKYRRLDALSLSPEGAPTVWPDALVSLTFAWPPELRDGFGGGQFPTVNQYPEGERARPIGSNLLEYRWTLMRLSLSDVTDDPHGPGTPVPGGLSAAWQAGRSGAPATSSEPAELVLFDIKGTFFLDRLSDAGESLPHDPIRALGTICRPDASALEGWTLGQHAFAQDEVWRLPPEIVSGDPTQSRVSGLLVPSFHFGRTGSQNRPTPLDQIGLQLLPPMVNYTPGRTRRMPEPIKEDRVFEAELMLGYAASATGDEMTLYRTGFRLDATIYLEEPIVGGGRLCLFVTASRTWINKGPALVRVFSRKEGDGGEWSDWNPKFHDLGAGRTLAVFEAPAGDDAVVRIEWPAGVRVGFLGLGGVTAAAHAAAARRNEAQHAAAAVQKAASEQGPLGDASQQSGASRCLLQPGRTYRIDVAFEWTGTLYKQIVYGLRVPAATETSDKYHPKGTGPVPLPFPAERAYFFKTTPVPPAPPERTGPTPGSGIVYGEPIAALDYGRVEHLRQTHHRQDLFAPDLLSRHLGGYEPAQSEVARFRRDPLRAHFDVGHVAALADLYGYTLKLGLRRTDVGGEANRPTLLAPILTAALNPALLSHADQRRYRVAAGLDLPAGAAAPPPCPLPKPGLTLAGSAELAPRAWYELYVHADPKSGKGPAGRLPGVSFQTSRWFGPADMLADLGFGAKSPGQPAGDLEIHVVSGFPRGPVLDDDGAFDDALDRIGLEGWPCAEKPRTSVLWLPRTDGSGWDCAGALVESPEPIHRAGRCHVVGLTVVLAPGAPTVHFDTAFRDRSGSRLLFLTGSPFRPTAWTDPGRIVPGGKLLGGVLVGRLKTATPGKLAPAGKLPLAGKLLPGTIKPLPRPTMRQPALRLSMADLASGPDAPPLTGLLALGAAPLFAAEAR